MAQEPAAALELPEDLLVEVLRRLAAHDLAASRWVCKAWRDAIHDHLRSHLLSRSVRGIFINYTKLNMSEFFSRPSAGPAICGGLDCLPCKGAKVTDHCNGLLLCEDWNDWQQEYVVNPATRRWARLPRRPPPHIPGFDQDARLAFDHAVSPHYQVYLIPRVPSGGYPGSNVDGPLLQTEWPPASHVVHVFSSITGRWEEKKFTREGAAAGVVADMASCRSWGEESRAVYWRGVLYVHGQCDFVIRMCLSTSKYQVIKMPQLSSVFPTSPHLGRSMRGVYYAISHSYHELRLWYLDESDGQIKWVLKHDIDLDSFGRNFDLLRGQQPMDKQWILQDVNYRKCPSFGYYRRTYGDYEAPPVEEKYEWNSDDDNILDSDEHAATQGRRWSVNIGLLGFHPYKEMVFLDVALDETIAYDWNSSKFQYLGRTLPKHYEEPQHAGIDTCFPYTPCWMHEFPVTSQLEDEKKPTPKVRWRPPPDGVIKINTDSCFLVNDMTGSSGLVIRDHNGALITAQALWYAPVANAPVMKALAIRDGARLARERGYQSVIIESDSKVVVDLYAKDDQTIVPEILPVCREIREIGRAFSSFSITHVGREANQAAHSCAKQASADKRRCIWINYIPGFLAEALSGDCNFVD